MGYKNKHYQRNLQQQVREKLESLLVLGESKTEAKKKGEATDKIYAANTFKTYKKHCRYFVDWLNQEHPEVTTLKKARPYVNEWLEMRVDQGLSAWTISVENQALSKLFGIAGDDPDRFKPPKRNRADIKRSRLDCERDKHFSPTNNQEFIRFCQGTGVRRNVCERLVGNDLWTRERMEARYYDLITKFNQTASEQKEVIAIKDALFTFPDETHFVYHRKDKGGRDRLSPIIGPHKEDIIKRFEATGKYEHVWLHVPTKADIHGYRGDYATAMYKMYARSIDSIPYDRVNRTTGVKWKSEVYYCRKDEAGKKLDKRAMLKASKALGHNRLNVIADNYVRNL